MQTKSISYLATIAAMAAATHLAKAAIDPKDYDTDGDGKQSAAERRVFLVHKSSPIHKKYDANKNGRLDPAEQAAWDRDISASVGLDEMDLTGDRQPLKTVELGQMEHLKSKDETYASPLPGGLQIRRSLKDIRFEDSETKVMDIPPAVFSYSRDLNKSVDTWTAHGVIARPFDLSDDGGSATLLPSISFDRVDTSAGGTTKEEDALAFRVGASTDWFEYSSRGENAGNTTFFLEARANVVYSTDFDFERSVWGGEIELEPVLITRSFGLHTFRELGPIFWRPTVFLHTEFGAIEKSLALPDIERNYLRMGPQAGLEITPNFTEGNPLSFLNKRILLDSGFAYYWDLDNSTDIRYLRAGVNWLLDEKGHVKLTAEYQHGSLQFDSQDVDTITVGLGVAF